MGWNSYLDDHQTRFIDALADFIAIPSVSAGSQVQSLSRPPFHSQIMA
jgi:hypothetical protein